MKTPSEENGSRDENWTSNELLRAMRRSKSMSTAGCTMGGTGLFLGSSKAIAHAGPAGALSPSTDIHFAERFLDPALGFVLGWLHWYGGVVNLPTEMIGATLIIGFWDSGPDGSAMPKSHLAGYLTVGRLLSEIYAHLKVTRWFGETEFIFALIKILLAIGCIIGGLVIDLGGGPGHDRIGFRYWKAGFPCCDKLR
ncbi:amino acid permease-domain-containing protein [Mycena vulgaris]|nr:amino acid permease-domain-containing protein [Mycena vulgaris]